VAPDALCLTDPPASGAGGFAWGEHPVGAASSRDLLWAMAALLSDEAGSEESSEAENEWGE
jgi:hypothetical protein